MLQITKAFNHIYQTALLSLSCLLLNACGGGDDSPPAPAPNPNGIYSGSITGGNPSFNGNERVIIYNNKLVVISEPGGIQQVFIADLVLNNTSLSAAEAGYYNNNIPKITTMALTGSFIQGISASISFSDNATSVGVVPNGTINLSADTALYTRGSSLTTIATVWNGTYTGFSRTMMITILADGSFSGSDSEVCNYTGTILPADASVNVYNVTLVSTGGGSCSSLPVGTYTGLAWTEGTTNGTLVFSVSDGINSRSIVMTK